MPRTARCLQHLTTIYSTQQNPVGAAGQATGWRGVLEELRWLTGKQAVTTWRQARIMDWETCYA